MTQVRHVLGISGGKDSAALAIYFICLEHFTILPLFLFFCKSPVTFGK